MTSLTQQLANIDRQLAEAMSASTARGGVRMIDDVELVEVLQTLGRIQRRLDGAVTEVTDRVIERDRCERAARLTAQAGCRAMPQSCCDARCSSMGMLRGDM